VQDEKDKKEVKVSDVRNVSLNFKTFCIATEEIQNLCEAQNVCD